MDSDTPKKHTLIEHLDDLYEWEGKQPGARALFTRETAWFTAYERWLNDRPLMTEEDRT